MDAMSEPPGRSSRIPRRFRPAAAARIEACPSDCHPGSSDDIGATAGVRTALRGAMNGPVAARTSAWNETVEAARCGEAARGGGAGAVFQGGAKTGGAAVPGIPARSTADNPMSKASAESSHGSSRACVKASVWPVGGSAAVFARCAGGRLPEGEPSALSTSRCGGGALSLSAGGAPTVGHCGAKMSSPGRVAGGGFGGAAPAATCSAKEGGGPGGELSMAGGGAFSKAGCPAVG